MNNEVFYNISKIIERDRIAKMLMKEKLLQLFR